MDLDIFKLDLEKKPKNRRYYDTILFQFELKS